MLMIKFLSSHVDLNTGENKHTMVVGRIDQQEGIEVDLDPVTYLQLGQVAQQLIGGAPEQAAATVPYEGPGMFAPTEAPPAPYPQEVSPAIPTDAEVRLEAQLRTMEAAAPPPSNGDTTPASPDDLLRQVGWFDRDEEMEPPKDALADLVEESSDPGEDYPEDDGVEEAL